MGSDVPVLFGRREARARRARRQWGGDCFKEQRHGPTLTASSLDPTTSGPLRLSVVSMRRGCDDCPPTMKTVLKFELRRGRVCMAKC